MILYYYIHICNIRIPICMLHGQGTNPVPIVYFPIFNRKIVTTTHLVPLSQFHKLFSIQYLLVPILTHQLTK